MLEDRVEASGCEELRTMAGSSSAAPIFATETPALQGCDRFAGVPTALRPAKPRLTLPGSIGEGFRVELWQTPPKTHGDVFVEGGEVDSLRYHLATAVQVSNGAEGGGLPFCRAGECSLISHSGRRTWNAGHQFEMISFRLPRRRLAEWARENELKRFERLAFNSGESFADPVLANLAMAILPSLTDAGRAALIFTDFVIDGMLRYLVQRFGEAASTIHRGGLTDRHVRLSKELMASRLDGEISLAELAGLCDLSVSYYVKAFRVTVGVTPHQWLIGYRLDQARSLLRESDQSLADVAAACGFADQSHFTRMFSRAYGISPGAWRRDLPRASIFPAEGATPRAMANSASPDLRLADAR